MGDLFQRREPADGIRVTQLETVEEIYDFLHTHNAHQAVAAIRAAHPNIHLGKQDRMDAARLEREERRAVLPYQTYNGRVKASEPAPTPAAEEDATVTRRKTKARKARSRKS